MRVKRLKQEEALEAWRRDQPQAIAVDTETTGFSWYDDAFCATIAWDGFSCYLDLNDSQGKDITEGMLYYTPKLVFHNAKFDMTKLIRAGVLSREHLTPDRIEDTDIIAHLLSPTSSTKLKYLARTVLGLETDEATAIQKAKAALQKKYKKETGKTLYAADIGYQMLPKRAVYPYALKDAEFTWELWKVLLPQLDEELLALYAREIELTLVLLDIEANGMKLDMEYVDREIKTLNGKILSCELHITGLTGLKVWYPERPSQKTPEGCLNPNSGVQIREWFEAQGITIPDTKESTLAALGHDLATEIVELRGYKKLLVTYLLNMKNDQRDGIIHPSYSNKPKTGRMSSAAHSGD